MNIKDLLKDAVHLTDYEFERKLNKLVRDNYRFRNLGPKNRKLVMELFKKHKSKFRKGIGMSYTQRYNELNKLKKDRIKLGLTLDDISDIKKILEGFKK